MIDVLKFIVLAAIVVLTLGGCVVKEMGQTVGNTVKGDYFLDAEKYDQGRESFERVVKENPESATANYYYGRFLLHDKQYKAGLKYLKKAKAVSPDNADYQFWAGVAYAGVKNRKEEEKCYRQALKIDPNHLQSLVYMGHNLLGRKKYGEAQEFYARALKIWPGSPSALYNRALIARKLGRSPEELVGWLEYLDYYPSGPKARRAVNYLNTLKDFSWRNHQLGPRTVTLEKIYFEPFSDQLSYASLESLNLVGGIVEKMKTGKLQILVYQKNNKKLAHDRAKAIKQYLLEEFPDLPAQRIGTSWFGEAQSIKVQKKTLRIEESVSFFISNR